MTLENFYFLIKNPDQISSDHVTDLKEMIETYPYFSGARVLLLKALCASASIQFESTVKTSVLYVQDNRRLYHYLYSSNLPIRKFKEKKQEKSQGEYFDMLNKVSQEGVVKKQSLKKLAEQLKSARIGFVEEQEVKMSSKTSTSKPKMVTLNDENDPKQSLKITSSIDETTLENHLKVMIQAKKYHEAIEILEALNLSNPKKSVYFADQIRFLRKIIENSK